MKDIFQQTNVIVMNNINSGPFNLDSLESQIKSSGAPMRLAPGLTVKEHIYDLLDEGVLELNITSNTFSLNNSPEERNYEIFNLPDLI